MKKITILLIAFICLSACSATEKKSNKKENPVATLNNNKKNDNDTRSGNNSKAQNSDSENNILKKQKNNTGFDSDFAISKVKDFLNITDSDAFSFNIMKQSDDSISVKVISKDIESNGGSGSVGIYIVYRTGEVHEDIIPDILKGTWKSKDGTISYIISDDTVQSGDDVYSITDVSITDDNNDYTTYQLNWDLEKYKSEHSGNFNPQPIIYRYHKVDDTIETGVLLYRYRQ